ncbi:hypothetical protein GQX74_002092, partial [Glossina fuscipes]
CILLCVCVHQHFRMSPYENVKGDVGMVDTLWFGFLCVCLYAVERIVLDYGEGNLQINLLSLTMHNKIVYVKSRHAAGNFDWQMFYGFKISAAYMRSLQVKCPLFTAKSRALRSLHRELMCFESVLLGDPQQLVRSLNADELFESVNSEININIVKGSQRL